MGVRRTREAQTREPLDPRDVEIARLRREVAMLREREDATRAEAQNARKHFSDLTAMSKRFAHSIRAAVGERQQQRRRLAAQYDVSQVLAKARDLEEAAPQIYEILGERLGWRAGALWEVDEDSSGSPVLRRTGCWRSEGDPSGAPESASEGTVFRRGEGLPGRVWERHEPVWVEDILVDEKTCRKAAAGANVLRGALAFPIVNGGFVGVFELFRYEVLPPDEDMMRTVGLVGGQISQFLERRHAEEERDLALVREREARERTSGILESINDAFFALDEEQRFTYVNRRTEEFWGKTRGELVGRIIWEMFPETAGSEFRRAVEEVLRSGEAAEYETVSSVIGTWISGRVYPSPGGVSVLFHSIEERKRSEETRRRSEERAVFRAALADAMRPLSDPAEVQNQAVRVLGEHLGVSRALYAEIADDGAVVSADYNRDDAPSIAGRYRIDDFGASLAETLRSGRSLALDDPGEVEAGLSPEKRAAYEAIGIRAHVSVPLVKDGRLAALLSVHQSEPRAWTPTEVALIEETAERTWTAVERARAEEALRESEERFRAIADLVPDLLWSNDPSGSTSWYNRRWFEYTGRNVGESEAYGWLYAVHPDDREPSLQAFLDSVDRDLPLRLEHRIRGRDGEYRWFLVQARPLLDDAGRVVRWFGAATDIHEQRVALEALGESEERYRSLAEATSSIVWTGDKNGAVVEEMPAWEGFTGQAYGEYRGFGWLDALHPEDRPPENLWEELSASDPVPMEGEYRLRRRDGEYRRILLRGVPILGDDGETREWVGTIFDVEETRRAEEEREELRQEAERERARLETILQQMPGGVFIADTSGRLVLANDGGERIYGRPVGSVEECGLNSLSYPDGGESPPSGWPLARALKGEYVSGMEYYVMRPDGTRRVVRANSAPVRDGEGNIVAAVKAFEDVTRRKEAEVERDRSREREREAREAAEEAERRLAFYAGAREERQVIGRELHDRVAHSIAVVRQNLELYEVLRARNPEMAAKKLELAKEEARASLKSTRDLSMMLRRSEVEGGLAKALAGLEETTVPPGVVYESSAAGDESLVPPHVGNQLFLVLREAVRNAANHSGCGHVSIHLNITKEKVIGTVEDDGRGFESGVAQAGGGLRSMEERASLVGGEFRLRSVPGGGSKIEVTVPLTGADS